MVKPGGGFLRRGIPLGSGGEMMDKLNLRMIKRAYVVKGRRFLVTSYALERMAMPGRFSTIRDLILTVI